MGSKHCGHWSHIRKDVAMQMACIVSTTAQSVHTKRALPCLETRPSNCIKKQMSDITIREIGGSLGVADQLISQATTVGPTTGPKAHGMSSLAPGHL